MCDIRLCKNGYFLDGRYGGYCELYSITTNRSPENGYKWLSNGMNPYICRAGAAIGAEDTSFAGALATKSLMLANGCRFVSARQPVTLFVDSKKSFWRLEKKESMAIALKPLLAHDRWSANRNSEAPFFAELGAGNFTARVKRCNTLQSWSFQTSPLKHFTRRLCLTVSHQSLYNAPVQFRMPEIVR